MSFFNPVYIDHENNNNNNIIKYNGFEENDRNSLYCLYYTDQLIATVINNFSSYKWKNKYSNLLKLDFNIKSYNKFNTDILKNNICLDTLYVNKNNNNNDIRLIYITPHIIFYNYINGSSTADLINLKIVENIENICIIPKYIFRSHENKSLEFIDNDYVNMNVMNNHYVTLKSFCESNNKEFQYDFENLERFITNIYENFMNNHFIPYFIHPQRLILFKDKSLRIISPNLLHYIFSPYSAFKKIQHIIFSHPRVLENINDNNSINNNILEGMMMNTIDLFLDFFHSLFVTVLWIYNYNNNILCESLTRNIYSFYTDMLTVLNKNNNNNNNNKKKKNNSIMRINEANFEQNYFLTVNNEIGNNNNNDNISCKNKFGFCLSYYNDNYDVRKLIHNYGCQHLQMTMPVVLDSIINEANDRNQQELFISKIKVEFQLFSNFLSTLKNINRNGKAFEINN